MRMALQLFVSLGFTALAGFAGAGHAEDLPNVIGIFSPGQGGSISTVSEPLPPHFSNQIAMYAGLVPATPTLKNEDLLNYYRTISFDRLSQDDIASSESPRPDVEIVRDKQFVIPRVYSETRQGAMFGAGYVRAQDRLWLLDVNRHIHRARLVELLGRGPDDKYLKHDASVFRHHDYSELEYQKMFDTLDDRFGEWGAIVQADLYAYVDGINAYLKKIEEDFSLLPVEYKQRNLQPQPWTVSDAMAEASHMAIAWGWANLLPDEGGELGNARLLKQLRERHGNQTARDIYADLRSRYDLETDVLIPGDFSVGTDSDDPEALALPDLGSFALRQTVFPLPNSSGGSSALPDESAALNVKRSKSSALIVAGKHTADGKNMSIQGPQDGFQIPHSLVMEIQLSGPDVAIHGMLELYGPYPPNGARGRDFAVSLTFQDADRYDTFVEDLCEPDGSRPTVASMYYRYRGKCRPFEVRKENRKVIESGEKLELHSQRSVHGPIVGRATVDGKPVALAVARSSFLHEGGVLIAYAKLATPSAISTPEAFVKAMEHHTSNVGVHYVGTKGIASVHAAIVPRRHPRVSGDFPVWGTGEWDWIGFDPETRTFERVPFEDHPSIVNPDSGIIASWNGQSGFGFSVKENEWSYGAGHRQGVMRELIEKRIAEKGKITRADLIQVRQYVALTDYRARALWPLISQLLDDELRDSEEQLIEAIDGWVHAGAIRADFDEDGYIDHGPAIALLDELWPVFIKEYFNDILGETVIAESKAGNNTPFSILSPGSANIGWISYLSKDLRTLLGYPVSSELSRIYCKGGSLSSCRAFVSDVFRKTVRATTSKYAGEWQRWSVPATCESGCLQIEFRSAETGAAQSLLPPIPWQNRPSFDLSASF